MNLFRLLLVTAGGLGLLRPAPGTWGSLPPVVVAFIMVQMGGLPGVAITITMLGLCLLASLVCLVFGGWSEGHFGGKDPGQVVIDEVAGQSIPLMFLPFAAAETETGDLTHNLILLGLCFALFRGFDITKPPPCHQLQKIPGGLGILIDDIVAGLYALICIQIIIRVIPL